MGRATGGMASQINPGTLSPGNASFVVNGQLVPSYRSGNYYPRPLAVAGPGGISSGISNPAWPPQTGGPVFGGSGSSAAISLANSAGSQPFSFTQSPVLFLIGAIIVVALLMHFVHHGY